MAHLRPCKIHPSQRAIAGHFGGQTCHIDGTIGGASCLFSKRCLKREQDHPGK
jgi:hypothetical protein